MSRQSKDDIDKFLEYGLDLSTRTYYMGSMNEDPDGSEGGVNYLMTERTIKALHILESRAPQGDKPITIIANNPGGDWYHGMGIYDSIRNCQNEVTMKAYGHVMSMGAVIFQAADLRLMAPNAKFMLHYGTAGYQGHAKDFIRWAKAEEKELTVMEDIFLEKIREKHPDFSRSKLQKMLEFDTILSAKETIELGLADGIVGEYEEGEG